MHICFFYITSNNSKGLRILTDNIILQKALAGGIIDIDKMQSMVTAMERKKALQNHKYNIWLASDNRWKTYVEKEGKRKLVAKASREKIEEFLINYYQEKNVITIRTLYSKWLEFKWAHTCSGTYIKRINQDWIRFYEKDKIVDEDILSLTKNRLDQWVHEMIKKHDMTKKQYYNMSIIIRQIFEYALDENIIEKNVFKTIKVNSRMFRKQKKKDDDTQVFLTDEKPLIEKMCWEDYRHGYHNTQYITSLAIAFAFQTGLRVGEIAALKFEDIKDHYIHVCRSEVRDVELVEGKVVDNGVKVVSHTKTDYGDREVYLTKKAREIIHEAKKFNLKYGLYDNGFIFLSPKNKRITELSIVDKLERICKKAHIPNKTMHKIRKTYVSTLLASGVSLNEVRKQVGHSDERITLANYCYNVNTCKQTEKQFEDAL